MCGGVSGILPGIQPFFLRKKILEKRVLPSLSCLLLTTHSYIYISSHTF